MHFTPWPRWFRIVSTATVVFPVLRSPMISSRWPRPIGVIASIALIPVEVQRQPERAALELQQLVDGRLRQPRHPRDPVTDLEDTTDPRLFERGAETADVLPQRLGDLVGVDGQLSHLQAFLQLIQPV